MPLKWATVASELRKKYIDEAGRCRICGEKIVKEGKKPFDVLRDVYAHFKQLHIDVLQQVKQNLSTLKPVYVIDRFFPRTHTVEEVEETGEEEEEKEEE